eukprot:CAMPEP_0196811640 /NCGR_PEP_ID=MMETSP1362-20130617/19470_1 /TAXON_ID=163516 /ORGANISM="Leptocylindrus danicus, Strain CCMP1856" /LENGTH=97 /DNA_ID=CAMNT_0042186999 /DNA_START=458 /DNA_END=751 /DNA_ORIENTATION=-
MPSVPTLQEDFKLSTTKPDGSTPVSCEQLSVCNTTNVRPEHRTAVKRALAAMMRLLDGQMLQAYELRRKNEHTPKMSAITLIACATSNGVSRSNPSG